MPLPSPPGLRAVSTTVFIVGICPDTPAAAAGSHSASVSATGSRKAVSGPIGTPLARIMPAEASRSLDEIDARSSSKLVESAASEHSFAAPAAAPPSARQPGKLTRGASARTCTVLGGGTGKCDHISSAALTEVGA